MNMRSIRPRRFVGKRIYLAVLRQVGFVALVVAATATCCRMAAADVPTDVHAWVDDNLGPLVELYRHFHQTPELSFAEEQTAARLAQELKAAGFTVTSGVGG